MRNKNETYRTLFSMACLAITVQVAGFLFTWLGGVPGVLGHSLSEIARPLVGAATRPRLEKAVEQLAARARDLQGEVAEGERDTLEALVREHMGNAYPLDVPLEVSVGYGRSWDRAAH